MKFYYALSIFFTHFAENILLLHVMMPYHVLIQKYLTGLIFQICFKQHGFANLKFVLLGLGSENYFCEWCEAAGRNHQADADNSWPTTSIVGHE